MAVKLIGFDHKVKWDEFEPKSPKVKPPEAAYIYAKFQVRYGYSYQDGGEGKHWVTWVRATATVEPESWVIQGMKDDELLRHEQGHFDIVALAMREAANLTSAITGTSADDLEAQKTAITEKFEKKMKAVSTRYDAQTDHSRKEAAQRRWLRSIRKAKKKKKKKKKGYAQRFARLSGCSGALARVTEDRCRFHRVEHMDNPISPYDAIPYQGAVVPHSAPLHLALCSAWHHGPRPPCDGFHLTELGCGDGSNLLPIAFYHPGATFVGVDNSTAGIDRARKGARSIGLRNVRFVMKDVCDLKPTDMARSDYIIAHGLYSWVSHDARYAILAFCRHNLSPSGLAYVSYNAQPGWATRRVVRDALLRAPSVRQATVEHRAARAIEVATRLLQDLPSRDYAHAVLLAEELERVRNGKSFYVAHEYLAEVNEGFWLGDFVERARLSGLDYVADAQFCRWEGHVPADLKASLANRDLDAIEQEEAADILCNRFFRASILCQADARRAPASQLELLEEAHVASSLSAQSDPFDLSDGFVERFRRPSGAGEPDVTLDNAITKAAVVLLAEQWPRGARLEQLFERATTLLATHGIKTTNHARSQYSADLTTLFEAGQVDLRLQEPAFSAEIPEYPRARALARFEAEQRQTLTTPFHSSLPLEAPALGVVRAADESRSRVQLEKEHGAALVRHTLAVGARFGLLGQR